MEKAYEAIGFENKPSTATPLGATNLNKMDSAIDLIDNRVVKLDEQMKEVFASVSNGKSVVASAITDMGIETETDATFQTMADNIMRINSGYGLFGESLYTFEAISEISEENEIPEETESEENVENVEVE